MQQQLLFIQSVRQYKKKVIWVYSAELVVHMEQFAVCGPLIMLSSLQILTINRNYCLICAALNNDCYNSC